MILILGGTSDARVVAEAVERAGYKALVSTATEYGAQLASVSGLAVRCGALDDARLEALIRDAVAVIDATHPFAQRISDAASATCARLGRPYLRFERPAGEMTGSVLRASCPSEAARLAVERADGGVVFVTVGSKTLGVYAAAARDAGVRLVARVLPTPSSLAACAVAGLEPRDVVAMQGPASAELDAALLRHLGATVLVTKESGREGGFGEKLRAAALAGAVAVVVERPAAATVAPPAARSAVAATPTAVLRWLARLPGVASAVSNGPPATSSCRSRGLVHVYTGDGKGKTTAAVGQALRARGAGLAVTFVQFLKGGPESSELGPLRAAGVCVVRPGGQSRRAARGAPTADQRAAAAEAWAAARVALADEGCDLVVLDELSAAIRHGLVGQDEVIATLDSRPPGQEVVITGRGAPAALLGAAAVVTDMRAVCHPYPAIAARRGVEW